MVKANEELLSEQTENQSPQVEGAQNTHQSSGMMASLAGQLAPNVLQRKIQRRLQRKESAPVGHGLAASAQAGLAVGAAATAHKQWSKDEVKVIQRHLARLGLYTSGIDGDLGKGSEAGLVEAFGGDDWRQMDAATVTAKLTTAKAPTKKAGDKTGDHSLRYGEMFKDGVLDLTVGVGFDEGENHVAAIEAFRAVLTARGLAVTDPAALLDLAIKSGHMPKTLFGEFFVKRNALTYQPPVGDARKVSIVVRLVGNFEALDKKEAAEAKKNGKKAPKGHGTNQGAQAAEAMKEGMEESDVAYYSGHGRYGSGPDFDRNMKFQLKTDTGWTVINDYTDLETLLTKEGKGQKSAWQLFQDKIAAGTLKVDLSNAGNLYLNPTNMHGGEFGSKVMYWCLNHQQVAAPGGGVKYESGGTKAMTGETGQLADAGNRKYQIYVFDGCRTKDYSTNMRKTPGHDTKQTDMMTTKRTLNWGDEAKTLAAYLDGIMGQFSAEHIIRNMDKEQSPEVKGGAQGGAYQGDGLADNPVLK